MNNEKAAESYFAKAEDEHAITKLAALTLAMKRIQDCMNDDCSAPGVILAIIEDIVNEALS